MNTDFKHPIHERWARLRFAVVGPLLAAPPTRGELFDAIKELATKNWTHPGTGEPRRFAASSIERWYYQAKNAKLDPVAELRRRIRTDAGVHRSLTEAQRDVLREQYRAHPRWSYRLHADNLRARVRKDTELGPMPSYASVRRFMKASGLLKQRRRKGRHHDRPQQSDLFEQRERRSFEVTHVQGLWHLDFHHGSLKVVTALGEWRTPMLLGVLDDHSRLGCHVQWYLDETAESLVHGLCQAFQKRGLPRALLTDNGSAMLADETTEGLARLGVVHQTTLPYSPEQNAKQEVFWAQVEGRLMAMLEGVPELTLRKLNEATLAWLEMEYQRSVHRETHLTPIERFLQGPSVGRDSPSSEALRLAFTKQVSRTQRRSDGTFSLEGVRFEVPTRYRHLERLASSTSRTHAPKWFCAVSTPWTRPRTPTAYGAALIRQRPERRRRKPRRASRRCSPHSWQSMPPRACRPPTCPRAMTPIASRRDSHEQTASHSLWPQMEPLLARAAE
jgi:putative transposase